MINTNLARQLISWLALLVTASWLSACGGGGGSPGTNSNGVAPPVASKVASVSLVASATTIDSSGKDGTEVTLTAIVKDAASNALSGETVSFTASSGVISNTTRTSNTSGAVVEKLSVKDSAAPRVITITANVGSVVSSPVTVTVVVATPTLTLAADSGVLASSGAAGSEVTLTALVKDAANNVVPGVTVALASDSGILNSTSRVTDANGAVVTRLATGGDPTTRNITVTASTAGAKSVTQVIAVHGNTLTINNSSTIKVGAVTDVTVKLIDSAGNALQGRPVTFSSGTSALSVKGGGAAVTNSAGQLILSYTATTAGTDTILVKSMGETATSAIVVSATNFTVGAVDGSGAAMAVGAINVCQKVAIHDDIAGVPQAGTVALSISRGNAYGDASCAFVLAAPLALVNGNAVGYVRADSPGVATLNATTNNVTTQGTLEFVAPYTASAIVSVQADPSVLGVNTAGSTAQQSTLRATVTDGTAQNNRVKNAQVSFSISDTSLGTLTQPSVVTTGADGTASIGFIAGAIDTKLNGVAVTATLQGASNATGIVYLTVAKKAASISAGTGNTIGTPDSQTYQVDYAVFVTDAAGNPVSGVNLTSSVRPRNYYKGELYYNGTQGPWQLGSDLQAPLACPNEDINSDNILQAGEDLNGDHALTPGVAAITVTPNATTDAHGQATVSLRYTRDRANWLDADLTITGLVSGTEARYSTYIRLQGLSSDYTALAVTPPGRYSPYGRVKDCSNTN